MEDLSHTCVFMCVSLYVYNIIRRSGRPDYEIQSTKNLIYLYNVYKTRNIIRVGQHAQIGESPTGYTRNEISYDSG